MENVEKIEDFQPSEQQQAFLEAYLSQEVRATLDELAIKANIAVSTYYLWRKKLEFNKWFYDSIQVNKYRFAPRIVDNIFTKAMQPDSTVQQQELALRVLDVYTPTEKRINENINIDYAKVMEIVKNKANELSKLQVGEFGISEKIE